MDRTVKPGLRNAAFFVAGAILAIAVAAYPSGGPAALSIALSAFCPGVVLSIPLLWHGLGLPWFFIPACAAINGLLFVLAFRLTRMAVTGAWLAAIPLVAGVALWATWYVPWCVGEWPKPVPPAAPVDLASPLAGRWEGVLHGERGDRPVALVYHPRTDGTLDGFLSVNGAAMEAFDEGTWSGDSVRFAILAFEYSGARDDSSMAMVTTVNTRMPRPMELRRVSADTARAALPAADREPR